MFSRKSDEQLQPAPEPELRAAQPLPAKSGALKDTAPAMPARKPVIRPEVVRAAREYSGAGERRDEHSPYRTYAGEGKKLIVGRDIALSGQISSCEKLVVEGRVEANIADCREMEIAESGTFKGEAEIDVAAISGTFEGTLTAHELLTVRAQGRINGKVRYGRLEVERGGQLNGDVRPYAADEAAEAAPRAAAGE